MAPNLFGLYLAALLLALITEYGVPGDVKTFDFIDRIAVFAPAIAVSGLLANLLPANIKSNIIFTRFRNVLPAHRIVQLVAKDERISLSDFENAWPDISQSEMSERNSIWYSKIYKPVQHEPQVAGAHQNYLLFRDGCSGVLIALLSIVVWQIFGPVGGFVPPNFATSAVLLVYFLLLMVAARNNGNRMVVNAVLCANK